MLLYKDIYLEIGKWLTPQAIMNMRISCKFLKNFYDIDYLIKKCYQIGYEEYLRNFEQS